MLTKAEVDELLERREGRDLDFKEGQYSFVNADEVAKSELLKDILAFANTTRMHDAYVLIGVREVKAGSSIPVGVTEHLDDASLQQFVNSKTNRKVTFSYEATPYENISLGVLKIDRAQARPLWVTKRFGKVDEKCIYMRIGSATAVASPDDIANMAAASAPTVRKPELSLSIYSPNTEECANAVAVKRTHYRMPPKSEIGDYETYVEGPMGMRIASLGNENRHFYRELASYISQNRLLIPVRLCVENSGGGPANDVLVTLRVTAGRNGLTLLSESELADKPERNALYGLANRSLHALTRSLSISKSELRWSATFSAKKVLPGQRYVFEDVLYMHTTTSSEIELNATILADELASQISVPLLVSVEVDEVDVGVDKLYALGRGVGRL